MSKVHFSQESVAEIGGVKDRDADMWRPAHCTIRTVMFSPKAEIDLGEIWDENADKWGMDYADRYTEAIQDACYALAHKRKRGRATRLLPLRVKKYVCNAHVIYYTESREELDVIRILHQRQDVDLASSIVLPIPGLS